MLTPIEETRECLWTLLLISRIERAWNELMYYRAQQEKQFSLTEYKSFVFASAMKAGGLDMFYLAIGIQGLARWHIHKIA